MKALETIKKLLKDHGPDIEAWFEEEWLGFTPLPYFSCDIRHAINKIGVVDTNLFPAGFNNLCNSFTHDTADAFTAYFAKHYPKVMNIALLAEAHTRNKFYLLNIFKLQQLLLRAGKNCRVTMPLEPFPKPAPIITLGEHETLTIDEPVVKDKKLILNGMTCDLIVTNNDFSSGVPVIFEPLESIMIPPAKSGWHKRSKSDHFTILTNLIIKFAHDFAIDPWLFNPITVTVTDISEADLGELPSKVDEVISAIQKKYDTYGVSETPYVFIKNDSGTYGLGLITAMSGDELVKLNRKKRTKLFAAKGTSQTERFIIQEGIPTCDTYSGYPLEPVIYGVGRTPIGGFFRIHETKTPFESLNAPGMSFSCLCLHKLDEPHEASFIECQSKKDLVIGAKFLARFASLAAARE